MERGEYERLAAVEERIWWFRGLHANLIGALERRGPRASGAGCSTPAAAPAGFWRGSRRALPARSRFGARARSAAPARSRATQAAPRSASASVDALPFAGGSFDAIVQRRRALPPRRRRGGGARAHSAAASSPAASWCSTCRPIAGCFRRMIIAVDNVRRYDRRRACAGCSARRASAASARRYWNTLLFPLMVLRRKLGWPSAQQARERRGIAAGAGRARCSGSWSMEKRTDRGPRHASALRRLDARRRGEAMTVSRSASSFPVYNGAGSIGELVAGARGARRAGRARDRAGQRWQPG